MVDDIFLLIRSKRAIFTDVELVISDYFLNKKNPKNIDQLSNAISVSKSSITRFCKKIGLNNYKELQFLYQLSLDSTSSEVNIMSNVFKSYKTLINRSNNNLSQCNLDKVCEKLNKCNTVTFLGKGFNSYAGLDFQFRFSKLNKYVRVITDDNSIIMAAHTTLENDLIFVATLRGEDESLKKAMEIAHRRNIFLVIITSNYDSQLLEYADVTLISAYLSSESFMIEVSPQIPILIQLDMLYKNYINLYPEVIEKLLNSEQILNN